MLQMNGGYRIGRDALVWRGQKVVGVLKWKCVSCECAHKYLNTLVLYLIFLCRVHKKIVFPAGFLRTFAGKTFGLI